MCLTQTVCKITFLWYSGHGSLIAEKLFTGRTHQTKIENTLSDMAVLLSGVVQGNGIGPLMFQVYVNKLIYILEEFNIKVKLFLMM